MYRERGGEELTGVLDYYLEGKESFSSTMVRGAFLLAPKYGVENDGKGMGPLLETVNGILARSTFLFSPTLGVGSGGKGMEPLYLGRNLFPDHRVSVAFLCWSFSASHRSGMVPG
jgi:hypothetical protein